MDVLENALSNTNGFSSTEVNRVSSVNINLIDAEMNCEPDDPSSGDCTSDDDDSEMCTTSTPTPTAELTTREPETSAPSSDPPGGPNTPTKANAKLRNPTPRPRGVSAWVIILIVLGAMAIVFIAVFLLYRWNHRYSGSFKPSKNEEGQTQQPGSDTAEQQFRTYNQPAFFVYKPPKKPTADSPVSI
ncbi:hypothetical protein AWC38_SpisGene17267 [Stylophora pistillata]|uniref:Uncharacterized protein n=2 Tax=Stylophora pistillata TaxID=50429 RepID=A0A2B4RPV7_STYPI|nr:hypothetical protein AWC38_SpisGene17267 [Stylophora pistillata]